MNIQEKIEQAIEDGYATDEETRDEIVRRWIKDARWHKERATTRKIERRSFKPVREAEVATASTLAKQSAKEVIEDILMARYSAELLSRRVVLKASEGEDIVTWGSMTLLQHRERADALIKRARSLDETAGRHLQAASDLERHGANTLAELVEAL